MELFQPTIFASTVVAAENELKKIASLICKYCGESEASNFQDACSKIDYAKANFLLDETVKKMTGTDNVFSALAIFAEKFPEIPGLNKEVSEAFTEIDKVKAIDKHYSDIQKIITSSKRH